MQRQRQRRLRRLCHSRKSCEVEGVDAFVCLTSKEGMQVYQFELLRILDQGRGGRVFASLYGNRKAEKLLLCGWGGLGGEECHHPSAK